MPSATIQNLNNNRRELPNVPKNTTNIDTKPPSTTNQNPFYNPSMTNNTNTSRSTPSQWMGNIGQTLRRQTSGTADVRKTRISIFSLSYLFLGIGW